MTAPRALAGGRGLLLPLAVILAWEAFARSGAAPVYLTAPSEVVLRLWQMTQDRSIFVHIGASVQRAGLGFAIGSLCGVIAGLAAGAMRAVERFYEPIVSLTYPVPKVAALPIIFTWFGLGELSKVVIITTAVFYPTYIAAFYGAKGVDRVLVWSARNMGASRAQVFFRVVAPSALPQVFNGLRVGLAVAFILMVTSEMIVADRGLGFLVASAQESLRFDIMYVALLVIGVIGFAADRLLLAVRRRALVGQLIDSERGHG